VDALMKATPKPETTLTRIWKLLEGQSARDFDTRMIAGQRFLRDLPAAWRTDNDRRALIQDARGAFVDAVAIARNMGDWQRVAQAEVAIAGCWFWVPSIEDVRLTLGYARHVLEQAVVLRAPEPSLLADLAAVRALQEALVASTPVTQPDTSRASPGTRRGLMAPSGSAARATTTDKALSMPNGRRQGLVKRSAVEGIGLIAPDDRSGDVILDHTSGPGYRGLRQGQRVSFATERSPRGPRAKEVRLIR
jgi:cold shock CspA family protein